MVDQASAELSESVFRALADPTRRQILQDLRDGELAAGEIAARFPISGPSVSRHLAILRAAGLVRERRAANRIIYSLAGERLALCLGGFLSAVCPEQVIMRRRRTGQVAGAGSAAARGAAQAPEQAATRTAARGAAQAPEQAATRTAAP
jgi:DNA-binding transcriptional ArsR family regulator